MNSEGVTRVGIRISNGTVSYILDRVRGGEGVGYASETAAKTGERMRRYAIPNVDKTSVKYMDVTYWPWVFYDR